MSVSFRLYACKYWRTDNLLSWTYAVQLFENFTKSFWATSIIIKSNNCKDAFTERISNTFYFLRFLKATCKGYVRTTNGLNRWSRGAHGTHLVRHIFPWFMVSGWLICSKVVMQYITALSDKENLISHSSKPKTFETRCVNFMYRLFKLTVV